MTIESHHTENRSPSLHKDIDVFNNYNFYIPSPDGKATITISEYEDGSIYRIDMNIGKSGASVAAWCNALSRMTTFALKNFSLEQVIKELEDISSDRFIYSNGMAIRSGPEALYVALTQYKILRRL